jgi:hypothetical protein
MMAFVLGQVSNPPLSERLLVAIAGPLISAVLGSLIIALAVWWVTNRAQVKHAASERELQNAREDSIREREQARADQIRALEQQRADEERAREHRRADNDLRHELISGMTAAASELYLATQSHWRAKTDTETANAENANAESARGAISRDELEETHRMLVHQYQKSRTEGHIIESRLRVFFVSPEPGSTGTR